MARKPGCEKIYEVFSRFIDQCLVNDNSLIWPEEKLWSLENLQSVKKGFIDNPIHKGDYWEKINEQFGNLNDECWKILADGLFVYTLPSTFIKPEKKYELIERISDYKGFYLPDFSDPFWDVLHQGFARTTMRYHLKYMQLWVIFLFAIEVKKENDRASFVNDYKKVKEKLDSILESIESKSDRAWDMHHALLHMAFPDYYEPILSTTHKNEIIETFQGRVPPKLRGSDVDTQLKYIRESFEEEYKDSYFGFYLPEIKAKWWKKGFVVNDDDGEEIEVDPLLDEMVPLLRRCRQIILYGPPGTGKTYYALKLAREVIAQDNFEKSYFELNEEEKKMLQVESNIHHQEYKQKSAYLYFCTFHPAYGYEEFIEGYRPYISKEGNPGFALQEGVFKRICKEATLHPEQTFVMIIDEINRGNIPRIFGELITLIEKDKRWKKEREDNLSLILPVSGEVFYVPDNVLIIGTMNTADRSIALLDIALRRRFGFRELMPMPELLEGYEIDGFKIAEWLRELNRRVAMEVGRNLQVGHSYLMENGRPIKEADEFIARFKDEIIPLLQEYCYEDYHKLSRILGSSIVDVERKAFHRELFHYKRKEDLLHILKEMCD